MFLYELLLGSDQIRFLYTFGLIPLELTQGNNFTGLNTSEGIMDIATPGPAWLTLFTSMFLHSGLMHFGGNMLFLWVFGDNIEDVLGHYVYPIFYVLGGLSAAGLQIVFNAESQVPMVGASGAIAGVLAGYLILHPYSRINTLIFFGFFISHAKIPAVFLLGFWFVLQFFSGIGSLSSGSGGIAYWAHIGGFLYGLAIIGSFRLITRRHNKTKFIDDRTQPW